MHTIVTFRLHRTGVIVLVICSLLLALVLLATGYLLGAKYGVAQKSAATTSATTSAASAAKGGTGAIGPALDPNDERSLRFGVFASEEDAKAMVAELKKHDLEGIVEPRQASTGMIYVVRAGRYATVDDARLAAAELHANSGLTATVIPITNAVHP